MALIITSDSDLLVAGWSLLCRSVTATAIVTSSRLHASTAASLQPDAAAARPLVGRVRHPCYENHAAAYPGVGCCC